jgi:hypothetical protein
MEQYVMPAIFIVVGILISLYILDFVGSVIRNILDGLTEDTSIGCIFLFVVVVIAFILYKYNS